MQEPTEKEIALAKVVEDFSNAINNFSYNENASAFFKAFSRQHRTLQQSMMRVMLAVIEKCATEDYRTDARNEDTKQVCINLVTAFDKEMSEKYGKSVEKYLPSKWLGTV